MKNKVLVFLLIILAISCFLRLWQLDLIPPGLYPDEAMNGNDALDTLDSKDFKIFYSENNGREGLFIWLLALSFSIFGASIWSIKIVSAFFGILTVLGLYLLTKELFSQSEKGEQVMPKKFQRNLSSSQCIALFSSFFLAISFWHINFSRISFRAILIPFILVFAFYFLFKGFRKNLVSEKYRKEKERADFIISGILFGLGFYTYISYRFVAILALIFLISWWFVYKKENLQKQFFIAAGYCVLATIIVALPIGIYFLQNPQDFFGRASGVSILNTTQPIYELGKSIIFHLGMFNFYGDGNWRHNFSGSPQLLWIVGIFFFIGFVISIKRLFSKKYNNSRFTVYGLLLSWFFIMIMPGFLSAEGIPHALRVISVIPVVYIFSGIGAYWSLKKIKARFIGVKQNKIKIAIFYFLISIFLFSISFVQFDKYFFQWANNSNLKGAFSQNYVKIGNYLNSLPDDVQGYVIVNQSGVPVPYPDGIPVPAQTTIFIERTFQNQSETIYLLPKDLKEVKIKKESVIIPLNHNEDLFLEIFVLFPGGKFEKIDDEIWIYRMNF